MVVPTKTETHVPVNIQKQTAIFHWDGMNYDIKIKKEPRRLLDDVDGWVKPGTLTALMGVSGAGKTTLLDVLASRVTMGVVSGYKYVDGRPCDSGFQRKTGYVQQQDLHLATSTVREALTFSAVLRQPNSIPQKERIAYVDEGTWSWFSFCPWISDSQSLKYFERLISPLNHFEGKRGLVGSTPTPSPNFASLIAFRRNMLTS